jgi:H+/Cl- antiporter ClcA
VQRIAWGGSGTDLLQAVQQTITPRRIMIVTGAGIVTAAGQWLLKRLTSANGIDTTAAIWFDAGRMPALRTLGSAVLSVIIVALGAPLGREGAPKQAGAVFANIFSDRARLSDEQRRLLVACAAGAGMAAAYGVPLGGALFALEVMRGALALRYVLPAIFTSVVATLVAWLALPDAPTYIVPQFHSSASVLAWTLFAGPIAGAASVVYVRMITRADRSRRENRRRPIAPTMIAPIGVFAAIGAVSSRFPEILGNGRDISQIAFSGEVPLMLLLGLVALRPLATILAVRCGAPGGLFTPSLTIGALLGALLGNVWSSFWPGTPAGLFALLGAAAVLAATTQGPVSSAVLMMELTGRDRSFIAPMLLMVTIATLVARNIEPRSVYDARLTDEEAAARRT